MSESIQIVTVTCEIPAIGEPPCPKCGAVMRWYDSDSLVCLPCQIRMTAVKHHDDLPAKD